ncbi:hypothetical protein WJX73_008879 [Symbiochloris irregularis]|uniref:NSFL1 cofactor p47 n=1 Tax=Symbiochloris irregularis TaxID=706552 RepID=A0AAW1PTX7_9CHLO
MADSEAVQQFMGVTGANESEALFFLESSGGNVETAIISFLDGAQSAGHPDPAPVHTEAPAAAPAPSLATARAQAVTAGSAPPASQGPRRPSRPAAHGKVRSLADLGADEQDEDSDEANEYYAGGEKSGQVVRVFTVNDGEPRSITDPANREFLDAVVRGECPRELEGLSQGAPVSVSLLRRNEDYVKPQQPRNVAFSGTGRTLAGSSSEDNKPATSSGNAATGTPANVTNYAVPTWEGVDEAQPSTSIQLRLADGSRMVARFNLTHTVGDIRRFILASQPEKSQSFRLATAFPAAALDDDSQTIQAAGLANAVVVQKAA